MYQSTLAASIILPPSLEILPRRSAHIAQLTKDAPQHDFSPETLLVISVIIPCYNCESNIRATLYSIQVRFSSVHSVYCRRLTLIVTVVYQRAIQHFKRNIPSFPARMVSDTSRYVIG